MYGGGGVWVVVVLFVLLVVLGVVNIIYAALTSFAQRNLKRKIAYSSISHMGFVLIGIGSFSALGSSGAMLQMISHGLIAAAMFFVTGVFYERTKTLSIPNMGGLANGWDHGVRYRGTYEMGRQLTWAWSQLLAERLPGYLDELNGHVAPWLAQRLGLAVSFDAAPLPQLRPGFARTFPREGLAQREHRHKRMRKRAFGA